VLGGDGDLDPCLLATEYALALRSDIGKFLLIIFAWVIADSIRLFRCTFWRITDGIPSGVTKDWDSICIFHSFATT
jgi:hypothetical protein